MQWGCKFFFVFFLFFFVFLFFQFFFFKVLIMLLLFSQMEKLWNVKICLITLCFALSQQKLFQTVDIVMKWTAQRLKNFKTPFFSRYSNFLSMSDWKWSKTTPVFSVSKYLNKYGLQRPSKFWPKWAVAGRLIE